MQIWITVVLDRGTHFNYLPYVRTLKHKRFSFFKKQRWMLDKSGILLKRPCLAMVRSGTAVCLSVFRPDPSSNRVCGKPNSRGEQATSKVYYKFILESLQMKKDLAKVNRRLCRQTSFGDKDCVCSNRLIINLS